MRLMKTATEVRGRLAGNSTAMLRSPWLTRWRRRRLDLFSLSRPRSEVLPMGESFR
jgi:hypothetical protein